MLNAMQTPRPAKWNLACSLTPVLVLWATIIQIPRKRQGGGPSPSFLPLLYKVPSWQHSPMRGSGTAQGGQLTKLHCKPCWVLSTLCLIWVNVNQKLTLHPREGSDRVVKHESADKVSTTCCIIHCISNFSWMIPSFILTPETFCRQTWASSQFTQCQTAQCLSLNFSFTLTVRMQNSTLSKQWSICPSDDWCLDSTKQERIWLLPAFTGKSFFICQPLLLVGQI